MSNKIEFNRQKYEQLKQLYNSAVSESKDQIVFEGHVLLTSYVKYLLEYLETIPGIGKK